jgi:CRP/FNR family transcriptional regulator, nitrogen oxide reductase regulator
MASTAYDHLIRQAPLFRNHSSAAFDQIAESRVIRSVEEGSFFFKQGAAARHLFVLVEGSVKIAQVSVDGQEVVLRIVVPGHMFGSIAVPRSGGDYPASAHAMEDGTAWHGKITLSAGWRSENPP